MASQPNSSQDRLRHLKLKIKAWEKEFASKNNGKPPSRQDISANQKMAARYSEYQKLKKTLHAEDSQNVNNQPHSHAPIRTPRRSARASQTPHKSPGNPFVFTPTTRPELHNPLDSSSAHRRLKWMTKGYVSPTPQKNGKVLGLFDKLPGMTPTPQKRSREAGDDKLLANLTGSAKKKAKAFHDSPIANSDSSDDDTYTPLDPTTPSRKRRYEFQTPLSKKSKAKADEVDPFATPAFFRVSQCTFELKESGSPVTPDIKQFLPNRGMIGKVKPLSTLVKELKEMQDSYEDPGADVLRELEQNELFGGDEPVAKADDAAARISKMADALLPPLDLEKAEEVENENAKKPPAYKKKGQKRQTRRVKIRPVRAAKASAKTAAKTSPESDSGSDSDDEVEAQVPPAKEKQAPQVDDNDSANEFPDSDEFDAPDISEDELSLVATKKTKTVTKKTQQKAKEPAKAPQKKMIKATQHQNYTRMKIHHKGKKFKGKGGRGRR
ncbi:hypothetical protein ABW21_db0203205 [Orbilia brochopaga]|nr:hypothetical protein ABW21_db0203205 [Drechslerella brochopaga]